MKVHLVLRHPRHPYRREDYMDAATVEGCYADKKQADDEAEKKNKNTYHFKYSVQTKVVKPA